MSSELTDLEKDIIWYLEHESILSYNLQKAESEGYFDEVPIHRKKLREFRTREGNPRIHRYIVPTDIRLFGWETADGIEGGNDGILEKATKESIIDNIFDEEPQKEESVCLVKTKTGMLYKDE